MQPKRYLRSLVAVGRSIRRGEYAVFQFGSGSCYRTDKLGALAVRALIAGRSDAEAVELVERIEAGAGERARRLILLLGVKGALTEQPLSRAGRRWRLRRLAARTMGLTLSVVGPLVRLTPAAVLAWMFGTLLSTPIAHHVSRSDRLMLVTNLEASGYAGSKLAAAARPSRSFNYVFMYLSLGLSPERVGRVVDRLFDRAPADVVAARLHTAGPTVGVFLHGPLCVAVPNILRARGQEVVRAVFPWAHGANVSKRSGPLRDFFGDSSEMAVTATDALAAGALLRHLNAGRSVYVALDELSGGDRKAPAEIEMLGHSFPRNDWPAWLAVRSGRPVALWTTHSSPTGVVLVTSPNLHPDPSLPVDLRVVDLSKRLYAHAEAAIRDHPEAWRYWSYLSYMTVNRSRGGAIGPATDELVAK